MNTGNEISKRKPMSPALFCLFLLLSAVASALCLNFGLIIAGILIMTVSVALSAMLMLIRPPMVCYLVFPISAAASAVLFRLSERGLAFLIIYISFIAAGGALAFCVSKKSTRTGTAVTVAAVFAVFLFAAWLYVYLSEGNAFTPDALKAYIVSAAEKFKTETTEYIQKYFIDYLKTTPYYGNAELSGSVDEDTLNKTVASAVESFVYMIPGLAAALIQVIGYICTCWFELFASAAHYEILMPSPRWKIYPTAVTVIIFIAAYIVYTVSYMISMFSGGGSVIVTVAYNIVLMIVPAMAAIGFSMIFGRRKRAGMRNSPILSVLILVILFLLSPMLLLSLLGLVGAIGTLVMRKAEAASEKNDNDKTL